MEELTIKNGYIYLGEKQIKCIKSYKLISSAEDNGVAELTLVIDVSIVRVGT